MCFKDLIQVGAVLLVAVQCVFSISVSFQTLSKLYLPYAYGPSPQFALEMDAAEQMSFDPSAKLLYSVGHTNIHVINMTDVSNPSVVYHVSYPNTDITDVEFCGGYVFVAFDDLTTRERGYINVYRAYSAASGTLQLVHHIIAGDIPDMIYPTADCRKVLVAVEAEPYDDLVNHKLVDNAGGIGILTFDGSPAGHYNYNVLGFGGFQSQWSQLSAQGVRWINRENSNSLANDFEPEYISLNAEQTKAYISLQENNAVAVVDLTTDTIESIMGLGFKDWSQLTLDPSDRDGGIHMNAWPVYGMYQPDDVLVYRHQGVDYLITANEGDSKDYKYFSEEDRVKHLDLSDYFGTFGHTVHDIKSDAMLGRLKVSTMDGLNATTNKYDRLYAFGARSFSIRRTDTMELVYDSGDELERKSSLLQPNLFNANFDPKDTLSQSKDTRSDDKGPEPESLTYGTFGDVTLLFVGSERPGIVAVYTIDGRLATPKPVFHSFITDIPTNTGDTWQTLYDNRQVSMLDCEDIRFISAADSPNGKPLLFVSGSISGTVNVIQIDVDQNGGPIVGR